MKKPNIIYIHSHDSGRYVQPYGYAISTPNIQQLAEQGILFRQAFCAGPTCSPARAALLTGQSPHNSGMLGLAHRGHRLNDYHQHILHTLRHEGYESALSGMQHIANAPVADTSDIGYDRIIEHRNSDAPLVAAAAEAFLKERHDKPFFLSVGFMDTHRQYPHVEESAGRYMRAPAPIPDTPRTRRDMAAFQATALRFDESVGRVLAALEQTGLADNTLVICTTDHGIAFPDMKCNLTDHGIGVMLIMRGPGGFSGGGVIDAMVSHIDVFPTICDLLDIDKPAWLQGKSMMPLVSGQADEINEQIFSEVTYHAAYEPKRAVRTQRYKYIRRYDERTKRVMPNCDQSPSRSLWLEHGWRDLPVAKERLYDLMWDPNERDNIAGDPASAETLEDMRARLKKWMQKTNDPLLNGPVHVKGAITNDPDGLNPDEPPTVLQ